MFQPTTSFPVKWRDCVSRRGFHAFPQRWRAPPNLAQEFAQEGPGWQDARPDAQKRLEPRLKPLPSSSPKQACFTRLVSPAVTSCHQGLSPKPTHGFILVGFNRQGPTWRHNLAIIGRSHFGARVLTSCKHIWSAADFKNGENAYKVSATEDDAQQMKGGGSSKAKS